MRCGELELPRKGGFKRGPKGWMEDVYDGNDTQAREFQVTRPSPTSGRMKPKL